MNLERNEPAQTLQSNESPLAHDRRAFLSTASLAIASLLSGVTDAQQRQTDAARQEMIRKAQEKISGASFEELFDWMDHTDFTVRGIAQAEFKRQVMRHIEQTGYMPPIIQDYYAGRLKLKTQPARLVDHLRLEFLDAEQKFLLVGSQCKFPKKEISVKEWLSSISQQIDRPVHFYGAETAYEKEVINTKSGTLWDVLNSARLKNGKRFVVYASGPTCVDLHIKETEHVLTASDGAVYATMDIEYGNVQIHTEPRLNMRHPSVVGYRERLPDGSFFEVSGIQLQRSKLPLSKDYSRTQDPMHIEVTVELQCFGMEKHVITPPNAACSVESGAVADGVIQYSGISTEKNETGDYEGTMSAHFYRPMEFLSHSRCAIATDGEELTYASPRLLDTLGSSITWTLGKSMPKKMAIFTPAVVPSEALPKKRITLVFERK